MELKSLKRECDNLSRWDKSELIEYLVKSVGGNYDNAKQQNCKHYNTTWSPREQKYRCRDCSKLGVSTENDRWK